MVARMDDWKVIRVSLKAKIELYNLEIHNV
jgi:hypothetical protein